MKTIKPQRLGVLTRAFENDRKAYFVVSALVFTAFDGPLLLHETNLWRFVGEELGKDAALDMCMPKSRGELLVTGKAFALGGLPRTAVSARVRAGAIDKTLWIVGDREWKLTGATEPKPFTVMPITYENAFGGEGYGLNPIGKGVKPIKTGGVERHPLPNVEDPAKLVRTPRDAPIPVGFGPYDFMWPQRFSKAGTYDAAWLKERFPGFAKDMDWSIFNAAPPDQQLEAYFEGAEEMVFENLHADEPRLVAKLPGLATRAFVNQKTAEGEVLREVAMRLDTVHAFPHKKRAILIYRGMIEVAEDDAADVLQLLVAAERADAPKSVDHYRAVLTARLDKQKGALLALKDGDLLPAPRDGVPEALDVFSDLDELVARENLLRKNLRMKAESQLAQVRDRLRVRGLNPDEHIPRELPPDPAPPRTDQLVGFMDDLRKQSEKAKLDAERARKDAEERARAACVRAGLDYDKVVADARKSAGGPPKFSARATIERARTAGAVLEGDDAERITRAEGELFTSYRRFAHLYPAASRLDGDTQARVRAEVERALAEGESLAGRDLTGADLSGLDFAQRDLRGALLEAANLQGASFYGADLTGAVLARADLSKAVLRDAKLAGANLGNAKMRFAKLDNADLTGAVLAKADLSSASFVGAKLTRADFADALFDRTDLSGVSAPGLLLLRSHLAGVKLAGADLSKASFLEVNVEGVDFTGARLSSAVFLGARGDQAIFRGAQLDNLRVVKDSSFAEADFRGALLDRANLRGTNLMKSNFSNARLEGADLSETDLRGARFIYAFAKDARFVRADLRNAVMTSANLMQVILQKAKLGGADLSDANLFRADFAQVHADEATSLAGSNVKQVRVVARRTDGQS